MQATDIKFYKALSVSGGGISTTVIESGVLHSFIPRVGASTAESGGIIFHKCFIKNTNVSGVAENTKVFLASPSLGTDIVSLFAGTNSDTTSNFNQSREFGIALTTSELNRSTKVINVSSESNNIEAIFKSGDYIIFINKATGQKIISAVIDYASASSITVQSDINASIVLNDCYVSSCVNVGSLSSGQSFGVWLKQIVPSQSIAMTSPPNSVLISAVFDA